MTPTPLFQKAQRKQAKLRLGICGPAGSGKTFSALQIAFGLGGRIAVIDTEHSSAELYAHLGDYDVAVLDPPFTVQKYLDTIHGAEAAGYSTIIIDSLSHAWAGEGGLLDQQGAIAKRGGNSYAAWRDITPMHTQLIEAMLQSPAHVIATMRSKTEYVLQENSNKKMAPVKVGMAPVQREGMDYEFTVVFDMGLDHTASVSKDRTSLFTGQYFTPTADTGRAILAWLTQGAPAPAPSANVEVSKPINSYQIDTSGPIPLGAPPAPKKVTQTAGSPVECGRCGATVDESPALRIMQKDGIWLCEDCLRAAMPKRAPKGEAQVTMSEPAPAPVKAVPKPPAKVPAPSSDAVAVCEECGAPVTDAQKRTSMLFVSRVLCSKCIDQVNGPQPGEVGPA